MRAESERVWVEGQLLHRLTMHPAEGVSTRAVAIFYHGQGDYAERYPEVLAPFTARGIRCVVTDLPGHGYSPGRRGHVGDEELLDAVVDDVLSSFGGLPYAVMGHSMGGLLAARHLVLAGQGRFRVPEIAWVNAPLLEPGRGKPGWLLAMAPLMASLMPGVTVSTGVTSAMCRSSADEHGGAVDGRREEVEMPRPERPLWHDRISFGWADVLFKSAQLLEKHHSEIPVGVDLLLTQGADDAVCPAVWARAFFERLPLEKKRYVEFEGGLHELFADQQRDALLESVNGWLDSIEGWR